MGWLFVPGLADSSLESNWPSEMPTGLSVAWNGKALQPQSWSRVSKIAAFRRFLSGLTFDPSTADAGVESWISSLRASRVSRSQSPAFAVAPKIPATSGRTSHGSSESASPPSSSLKTFRGCSQLGLPMGGMPMSTSSPIYEDWVTKLRLASSRRRKSALRTSANGSSSWPTPDAQQYGSTTGKDGERVPLLGQMVKMWPTPRSEDSESAGNHPGATDSLTGATGMWPTPNTPTGGPNTKSTATHTGGMDLDGAAALWQTPAVADGMGGHLTRGGTRANEPMLPGQAARWMTPTSRDWKDGADPSENVPTNSLLSRQAPRIMSDGQPSSESDPTSRRRLSPLFTEWLMGWPPGWTSLAPLDSGSQETAWSHWPQLMRSELSRLGWGTPDDNC